MLLAVALSALFSDLLQGIADAEETAFRINEKLSTDAAFYEQWSDLIKLQERQAAEHIDELYTGDALIGSLRSCGRVNTRSDRVDVLRIEDIGIYADLGHLATFCRTNYSRLSHGDLDACGHHSSAAELPTIDKFLRYFNPKLNVINAHRSNGETLTSQIEKITEKIQAIPGYEEKWKLIMILPNIQDGEASETGQAAIEVAAAVEYLAKNLDRHTLIVIVRNSGKGIWRDASHAHSACRTMLDRWKKYVDVNQNDVWDQVDLIFQKNYLGSEFSVEILPLLNEAALSQLPNGTDLSALGYDCAHWSERGLSLIHKAIWNALMTPVGQRTREYRTTASQLLCPEPRCPFIRTSNNSPTPKCLWNELEQEAGSIAPQLIALAILAVSMVLCLFLALFLCLRKTPEQLKKEKAFGSNLSSIRFIDDEGPV